MQANIGNQLITWSFQEEARSSLFNYVLTELLPYGIYKGGNLVYNDGTSVVNIYVEPLVCFIKSSGNDNISARIQTTVSAEINGITSNNPYIVLRFTWEDSIANYMEIIPIAWDNIKDTDIILGKVLFEENVSFDFSRKQNVYLKDLENFFEQFKVQPPLNTTLENTVYFTGGVAKTSKGYSNITGGEITLPSMDSVFSQRIDLIAIDDDFSVKVIEGKSANNPIVPDYENYIVIAEVTRYRDRAYVMSKDIKNVAHNVLTGAIAAENIPVKLHGFNDELLVGTSKNIDSILTFLLEHSSAVNPYDNVNDNTVLRRHINFGIDDPDEVYAASVPVRDLDSRFQSNPKNVENVLTETHDYLVAVDEASVTKDDDQTITGLKTFQQFPIVPTIAPSLDGQVVPKKYVDDTVASFNEALIHPNQAIRLTSPGQEQSLKNKFGGNWYQIKQETSIVVLDNPLLFYTVNDLLSIKGCSSCSQRVRLYSSLRPNIQTVNITTDNTYSFNTITVQDNNELFYCIPENIINNNLGMMINTINITRNWSSSFVILNSQIYVAHNIIKNFNMEVNTYIYARL